jgi:hypothetical protein
MPDFGTYEGHRILSQAMDNAVGSVKDAFEFKEQQKNNEIARKRAEVQYAAQERENNAAIARQGILQNMFRDVSDQPIIQKGPNGEPIIAENFQDILDTWTNQHTYQDYIGQSGTNPQGKDWTGKDLTYADMQYINEASTDYAKTKLLGLKKSLSHLDETQFNQLFEDNPEFANAVEGYLMELGQQKSPDEDFYETFNQDNASSSIASEIEAASYFTPGDDYDGYMTVHGDTSDWGGGTYFKSNTLNPTKKDVKEKGILLQAIEDMRNWEVNQGKWSKLDDMWLEASGDGKFMLGENDGWSANDYYEVRVHEGKAQVKVNGQWQDMSGSSAKVW